MTAERLMIWRCPECDFWMRAFVTNKSPVTRCSRIVHSPSNRPRLEVLEVVPADQLAERDREIAELIAAARDLLRRADNERRYTPERQRVGRALAALAPTPSDQEEPHA